MGHKVERSAAKRQAANGKRQMASGNAEEQAVRGLAGNIQVSVRWGACHSAPPTRQPLLASRHSALGTHYFEIFSAHFSDFRFRWQ